MSKALRVVNGELYIYGNLISRSSERPWLFSITDVHKACSDIVKKDALEKGKDPEVLFRSKQPNAWLKNYIKEDTFAWTSRYVSRRVAKHGISCGFGTSDKFDPRTDPINAASLVATCDLTPQELCMHVVKGGSTRGNSKTTQGTFVCQDFIVGYASFLSVTIEVEIISTFISVLNGHTKEVTKQVKKNDARARPMR